MKQSKTAITVITVVSLFLFYLFNRTALVFEGLTDDNVVVNFTKAVAQVFPAIVKRPFLLGTSGLSLTVGLFGASIMWLLYAYNVFISKRFMRGIEHGSARWGTPRDIKPLTDPVADMNIPLSATEQISIRKVKNFNADRNKNITVIGGAGVGKTYSEFKPSIMQLHSSYVITDPKGTLLPDTGHMLADAGYEINVFNTIDFSKSMHYNPIDYIKSEKDILKVVNVLIENTKGEGKEASEKFWVDCERLLYTAFIAYMLQALPVEEQNLPTMITLIEESKVKEEDEDYESTTDILFSELEELCPDCLAVKQYKKFKQASGKTLKSILISCAARLAVFDIDELREITSFDELHLDEVGDRKTALFVIMSDIDKSYSFLIAMIMYQMFDLLTSKADKEYGGELKVPVRCLLDEFANIGKIPDFHHLISTIRSRRISCMIGLQSMAQLKSQYKDDADTIIDCCDTVVYLGGKSTKTTKEISEMVGKTTIDHQNINVSHGQNDSYSINDQIIGRDLIDPAEISRLQRDECLVLITGLPPFKSKKYPTSKHKRFKQIADGGREKFDFRETCRTHKRELTPVQVEYYGNKVRESAAKLLELRSKEIKK